MSKEKTINLKVKVHKYQPYYYAGASLDFNTIHIDNDFAKNVGLGGIILQGLCTMAYVYRAAMSDTDPGKIKNMKVRFSGIVKPEDEVVIKGQLTNCENNLSTYELTAENQDSISVITNAQIVIEN